MTDTLTNGEEVAERGPERDHGKADAETGASADVPRPRKIYALPDGVQSYGIGAGSGSRNVQRYNTDLADVQKMIHQLEEEIEELEAQAEGQRPRKTFGVVPVDW